MTAKHAGSTWRALESLFDVGALGSLTDGELLDCFQTSREALGHDAFRILVERHGPMVLGLCRSLVRDPHEADDAFQATFLILVRKADSIRRRDTLGPWLHGVAGRVARRARQRAARRKLREVEANEETPSRASPIADSPSAEQVVQEEIGQLAERFRAPVVLCCLEGLSYEEAAYQLGVSEPTLRGRLYRARQQLAERLRYRGITAGAFASAGAPARLALPSISATLVETTVQFSIRWTSVTGLLSGAAAIPDSITGLAQGVLKIMFFQSPKQLAIGILLACGILGTIVLAQSGKYGQASDGARPNLSIAANSQVRPNGRSNRDQDERKAFQRDESQTQQQILARKTREIEKQLDLVVDAKLSNGTTLEQLLKYIKQQTTQTSPPGIPIYVNANGLQEANASMTLRTQAVSRKASWRVILEQALQGTNLSFIVIDGFLMIDSRTGILERRVREIDGKLDRVLDALERIEKAR